MPLITLLRHGQSEYNLTRDPEIVDAKVTDLGREQAEQVEPEHFDLAICSTLTCTKQTLDYTRITYDKLILLEEAREKRDNKCDFLEGEEFWHETNVQMVKRIQKLKKKLLDFSKTYKKILLVGHCQTFKFFLATNNDEILQDVTDTVLANGPHLKNCEKVVHMLEDNGAGLGQNGIGLKTDQIDERDVNSANDL